MKIILTIILLTVLSFADVVSVNGYGKVKVADGDVASVYANEFNNYPVKKLTMLTNALLNGVLDTNKSIEDMVISFVETSGIGKQIAGVAVSKLPKNIGGQYRPYVDSIYVSSDIKDKKLAMYVVLHELTHAVQFKNQMYTSGRKTLIINELFADYSAARFYYSYFNEKSYRQSTVTLSMYFDRVLETRSSYSSKLRVLEAAYISITRRLHGRKEAEIQRENLRKALSN